VCVFLYLTSVAPVGEHLASPFAVQAELVGEPEQVAEREDRRGLASISGTPASPGMAPYLASTYSRTLSVRSSGRPLPRGNERWTHLDVAAVLEAPHGPIQPMAAQTAPGAGDLGPDLYLHGLTSNSYFLFVTPL
jgi:hypothetical protein